MAQLSFVAAILLACFSILLLSSTALVNAACPSMSGTTNPSAQTLSSCAWYSSSTCCSANDVSTSVTSAFTGVLDKIQKRIQVPKAVLGPINWCIDGLTTLSCAKCSPDLSTFAHVSLTNTTINVCNTFCQNLYNRCKYLPSPKGDGLIMTAYDTSTEFCNKFVFKTFNDAGIVKLGLSDSACFNGASQLFVSIPLLLAALVISVIAVC